MIMTHKQMIQISASRELPLNKSIPHHQLGILGLHPPNFGAKSAEDGTLQRCVSRGSCQHGVK